MQLAIDTVTDRLSVALGTSMRDALTASVDGARRHTSALLPAIDALLLRVGRKRAEISAVLLADGPGSFTGLRVGAAVAKALALAGNVEVRVGPSLQARAAHVAQEGEVVVAVSDALRGEVYAGAWIWLPEAVETILPLAAHRPDMLRQMLPHPDVLVGEVPSAARPDFEGWARRSEVSVPVEAAWLFELATWPGAMVRVVDPNAWEPEYGRPAEAQARWEAQHRRPLPHPSGAGG
jgi:tRNA threonylcarbamoyl adenosine modification protein YeaZ